jgi:hypothetical protein
MTEKTCPKCGVTKEASQFYVSKKRPDGLSSYCRTCQVLDAKARYNPHPRYRPPEGQKWCPGCQSLKMLDEFGSNRSSHDGKQQYCKPCAVAKVTASRHKDPTSHRRSSKAWRERNPERHADNHAKWMYGIEHGTYAKMLATQDGQCAICRTDDPKPAKRFHIDHCHETGDVRGLLCTNCNVGLGHFRHDQALLAAASTYLGEGRSRGGD